MLEGTFEVRNELGLHARAASKLVTAASKFNCDVQVSREGQAANAKSVMGVLLLCGSKGTLLTVTTCGDDEVEALASIGALIESGFCEGVSGTGKPE